MAAAVTATATAGGEEAKVKEIYVYPIKSCRGISLSQAPLSSTGFRWDRQWLIINSNGRAYTQRIVPKIALIQVELPNEAFSEGWKPNKNSYLVVRAPGMDELKVPMSRPSVTSDGVSVWEWSGSALDEGDEAAKWFTDYLGKPSRLVRFNEGCLHSAEMNKLNWADPFVPIESETRPVDTKYAVGFNVMFSDAFPFLLLSQGSLDALNELLKETVSVNRFRPNIFVDGCEPYAEDFWKDLRINELAFEGVCLCPRCKIPTINQETAIPGREPSETLKTVRSDKVLPVSGKQQGNIYLGQFMVCKDHLPGGKEKMIKVGDPIYLDKVFQSYAEAPVWL